MEIILLGVTVVSLLVALVMSVTAWRVAQEEKKRSAARVAALSIAASDVSDVSVARSAPVIEKAAPRAPWAPAPAAVVELPKPAPVAPPPPPLPEMVLNTKRESFSHASGFLGAASEPQAESGSRQRSLAMAAAVLCVGLLGGLVWMMAGPRGTSAAAVGPNSPLELVSLRHERLDEKLAVSGLVRNPAAGKLVERLSAVVFLFDRQGAFVTSAKADVDFLKLGAGDESPFVVSIAAPATVARYRVSFRTDEGVVPHIDRRGTTPLATEGEQPVSVTLK
jgi:hypothetical protein